MIEIAYLRAQPEEIKERLKVKHFKDIHLVDEIVFIDAERRSIQKKLDDILAKSNELSARIGILYKDGKKEEADVLKKETTSYKEETTLLKSQLETLEKDQEKIAVQLPNLPHSSVPLGKTPEENVVSKEFGVIPTLYAGAKPHWELAIEKELFDLELGVKITGAGFPVYKGKGARLQRALINFFLDEAANAGFTEYVPPFMVNEDSAYATGQLPDKEGQMYFMPEDQFYMIPTAEVPVTNIYRDVIVKEADLPIQMTAYSPCFRREAGSYGKDVRGLNRVHQFEKIEIVCIEHPDKSYERLEKMCAYVETLLQKLELPYRILKLCGGDMSFASALTYDFEVYSTAQQRWLEVSSVSNFETYQSNRLKLRFKDEQTGKTRLAHTLNGSALALPRIYASILENHQSEEGINIPKALQVYTSFNII
ncbi:MAG: serine--tRNA ligase [Bacteroidota bacterium]